MNGFPKALPQAHRPPRNPKASPPNGTGTKKPQWYQNTACFTSDFLKHPPGKETRVGQCPLWEQLAGARDGLQDPNPPETLPRKPRPWEKTKHVLIKAGFFSYIYALKTVKTAPASSKAGCGHWAKTSVELASTPLQWVIPPAAENGQLKAENQLKTTSYINFPTASRSTMST